MIALLALLIGCSEPIDTVHDGIGVGNPPGATMRFALGPGAELAFDDATIGVSTLFLESCDGAVAAIPVDAFVGLQGNTPIDVPYGTFCLVAFTLGRAVRLSGTGDNGGTFEFTADIGRVLMYGEVHVPRAPAGRDLVLELAYPDWVSQDILGLQPATHREIGPACADDPACVRMRRALADQSAIYDDAGADGQVEESERETGAEAEGSDRGL